VNSDRADKKGKQRARVGIAWTRTVTL
jgi:hypothetical protein